MKLAMINSSRYSPNRRILGSGPPGTDKHSPQPDAGETSLSSLAPDNSHNNAATQATNNHKHMTASPVQTGQDQTAVTTSLFTWTGLL
ncbi:hypothetical protein PtB15_9B511 [Puccinia triticina]|nr:hypothetical protein PtB15_9B511 [Puccinia triticina]